MLAIQTDVSSARYARIFAEEAYAMGASDVDVIYGDFELSRIRISDAGRDALSQTPEWKKQRRMKLAESGGCILNLSSPHPDAFSALDPKKIMIHAKTASLTNKKYNEYTQTHLIRWASVSVPGKAWARSIFPEMNEADAIERLWEDILHSCHADCDDPSGSWKEHVSGLKARMNKLNALDLAELRFKSSNGTDFSAALCDDSIFLGGSGAGPDGIEFCPNIPTEEVFMIPHRLKVNGIVKSSLPLVYQGNIISDFTFEFHDGRITHFHVETGNEMLKRLLDTDEGSRYIGECALVSADSPIKQSGHLFYSTLFDENAACHMALGNGYAYNLQGEDRSIEALKARGLNVSRIHVDFMFGTDDTECIGITKTGERITILKNGLFVI